MERSLPELPRAQEAYSQFILSQFPANVKTILDVGSGAGKLTALFFERGYQVDCVSPSPYLTARLEEVVRGCGQIFPCKFEDVQTDKKYDLVLFSESFQYVDPRIALQKAEKLLNTGGHALIADFFRKSVPGESPLGGGHEYDAFMGLIEASALELVRNLDITDKTAPTMEVFGNILTQAAVPVRDLVSGFIQHRHPYISRFLAWRLKKRFNKINRKYFSGALNGKSFADFKTYRLLLLKRPTMA
jgi:SAM-dependent methyltransferase